MCGASGPSAADLARQEQAATLKAQAETDKLRAEKALQEQKLSASALADSAALANADLIRRQKQRTILAGLGNEETSALNPIEDPTSKSATKAKRASTLLSAVK